MAVFAYSTDDIKRLIIKTKDTKEANLKIENEIQEKLKDFYPTDVARGMYGEIALDRNSQKIKIIQNVVNKGYPYKITQRLNVIRCSEILDFDVIENGSSIIEKKGVGRAITGGLLFGVAGAIVGASTGKRNIVEKCNHMDFVITTSNNVCSVISLPLIISTENKTSARYISACNSAKEIASIIQTAISIVNDNSEIKQSVLSSADELRKFKSLLG